MYIEEEALSLNLNEVPGFQGLNCVCCHDSKEPTLGVLIGHYGAVYIHYASFCKKFCDLVIIGL